MYKPIAGQCFNSSYGGAICDERRAYQNYYCPYQSKKKCPYYIPITEKMIEHYKKFGYMVIPAPEYVGLGKPMEQNETEATK